MAYTFAHLSDLHLPIPIRPKPRLLINKRIVGYLSWRLKRRHIHSLDVLGKVITDLQQERPDHVLITGDLVNISLPCEFEQAGQWLRRFGSPRRVTVVPGNHDHYVPLQWREMLDAWEPYMRSDPVLEVSRDVGVADIFPFVRRLNDCAIVGMSTAHPTRPGLATGTLGEDQLRLLESHLTTLGNDGLFRIVMLHHPPLCEQSLKRKRLTDASEFAAVISRVGAELIVHGHQHCFSVNGLQGPFGRVPVFGTSSASARAINGHPPAEYHLYDIEPDRDDWRLTVRARRWNGESESFQERIARRLTLRRPSISDFSGSQAWRDSSPVTFATS